MISNKKTEVLLHILIWGLILFIPFLFFSGDSPKNSRMLYRTWTPIVFSLVLFYVNYLWLVKSLFLKKNYVAFIGINLLLILLFIFSIEYFQELFIEASRKKRKGRNASLQYYAIMRYSFTFILSIVGSIAFRIIKQKQLQEIQREKEQNEQLSAELQHLKYQIQPHFFLNTLNNIYSLTDSAPEKAKTTIHGLSKLMRYLLYTAQSDKVTLEQELDFIKKYIDLMKIRIAGDVEITTNLELDKLHNKVAPLLFIPLVENAFKHGISATKKSFIHVEAKWENETMLLFIVKNSNYAKDEKDQAGSGIGIANLKKRLEILYTNNYEFEQTADDDTFVSTLMIKL